MGKNMQKMMKQMQQMQQKMTKLQEEMKDKTVEATAGGEAVTAVVNGQKELVDIEIDQETVDPDDVEMLEDLVLAAVNEALKNADEMVQEEMKKITGGMNLPPGMF